MEAHAVIYRYACYFHTKQYTQQTSIRLLLFGCLQVKLSVIWEYIKACTFLMGFLTLIFNVVYNGCAVASNIWLAKWSSAEDSQDMDLTTLVPFIYKVLLIC